MEKPNVKNFDLQPYGYIHALQSYVEYLETEKIHNLFERLVVRGCFKTINIMYLDTRNLQTEREELKQSVLDSFLENFPHYEDMTDTFEDIRFEEEEIESWKEDWLDELKQIEEIDNIENECSEFSFGETLIEEGDFEEYCEEFIEECGYINKDMPYLIRNNIDFKGIADDMRQDYSEVDYQGKTYLFRA